LANDLTLFEGVVPLHHSRGTENRINISIQKVFELMEIASHTDVILGFPRLYYPRDHPLEPYAQLLMFNES
jgi:hypothetical protein